MGGAVSRSLARKTTKSGSKRRKAREETNELYKKMVEKYDLSNSATLSAEEVRALATDLLTEYTPQVGGLTDNDIDYIMRLGGDTALPEIKSSELPMAVAQMMTLKQQNAQILELFQRHDTDHSGDLPAEQLETLLTELNEGVKPSKAEIASVLKQCGGNNKAVPKAEVKAAIACWFCGEEEE